MGSLADDCLLDVESNRIFYFEIANFGNVMNVAMDEAYNDEHVIKGAKIVFGGKKGCKTFYRVTESAKIIQDVNC